MRFTKEKKGFTLLELMIVVIIIGILATLAIPKFVKGVDKAREAGATAILGTIRSAQFRYYAEYRDYTSDMGKLDATIEDTATWDVQVPVGDSTEIGQVVHIGSGVKYEMSEDGTVTVTP